MENHIFDGIELFQEIPIPIILIDLDTNKILSSNKAATQKLGFPAEDLLKMDLSNLRLKEDKNFESSNPEPILNSNYSEIISRCLTNGKGTITTSITSKFINTNNKRLILSIINDIPSEEINLLDAQSNAIESERECIARELHDGLIQYMVTSSIYLSSLKPQINSFSDISDKFNLALDMLKQGIEEARNLSHNLLPRSLKEHSFQFIITDLISDFKKSVQMDVNFNCRLKSENVPEQIKIHIYRILQESLGNVRKHSKATSLSVKILEKSYKLVLEVEDDGVGFDTIDIQKRNLGIGLKNLRKRTALIGGTLSINSKKCHGTKIILCVPIG